MFSLFRLTTKGFKTVLEIDTLGTFNMSRQAFPALKNTQGPLTLFSHFENIILENLKIAIQYSKSLKTFFLENLEISGSGSIINISACLQYGATWYLFPKKCFQISK